MLHLIARISPVLVIATLLAACEANDMGTEFVEIDEEQSNLIFYGPGLEGGYRKFLTGKTARFDTVTVGIYGPRLGGFPRAQIHLTEAAPGRYFPTAPDLPKFVNNTKFFKGREITQDNRGGSTNAAGDIRYMTFMADTMPCTAFVQFLGARYDTGVGSIRLSGFYCRDEGDLIATGEAVEIVRALGHREYGAPKPPAGWGK